MKITGIIAEFNPFHRGHKYLIDRAREETEADIVLVLMSGNFVQRGEPAIFDMGIRTEEALKNGADLVFELPPFIALSSAEGFASGGVSLLDKLGADCIAFGSECGDIEALSKAAEILSDESNGFKSVLQERLKAGDSFPAAREAAVKACISGNSSFDPAFLHEILHKPNNILALEYLKALIRSGSSITPYTVNRINASYHDDSDALKPDASDPSETLDSTTFSDFSAESIRNYIYSKIDPASFSGTDFINTAIQESGAVHRDSLTTLLLFKLLSDDLTDCLKKAAVPYDLINRIIKNRNFSGSFSDFCDLLKTKNITYTAVSRHLLHMILDMDYNSVPLKEMIEKTGYVRLLGFSRRAEGFLNEIKGRSSLNILSNSSDIKAYLRKESAAAALTSHLRIDRTYNILRNDKKRREHPLPPEISRQILVINDNY